MPGGNTLTLKKEVLSQVHFEIMKYHVYIFYSADKKLGMHVGKLLFFKYFKLF